MLNLEELHVEQKWGQCVSPRSKPIGCDQKDRKIPRVVWDIPIKYEDF